MLNDIIDAINALIVQQFPSVPVYIQNQGEGFRRPSFFINHIQSSTDDMNRWVYNNNILIEIVYFAALDDYKNVDMVDQNNTYDALKKIFTQGYFMLQGRAAKIRQLTGGPRDAEIYLTLNIDLTDERINTAPAVPTVGEVKINIKGGES